ncbi:hypothetical protein [Microcoleus sp. CZ3-B4]
MAKLRGTAVEATKDLRYQATKGDRHHTSPSTESVNPQVDNRI